MPQDADPTALLRWIRVKAAAAFLDKVEGGFETRPYGTTQRGCLSSWL